MFMGHKDYTLAMTTSKEILGIAPEILAYIHTDFTFMNPYSTLA
jgi:hypothetical protein